MAHQKNRYWCGVLYPENMLEGWESSIGDLLQLPYCYCIHNMDLDKDGDERKEHIHLIIAFNNTTTYNHAFSVFSLLNAPDKICVNAIKGVINIRHMYNYLIHDTEDCRKKDKFQYDAACRVSGNLFDIGSYEQVSLTEKSNVCKELCNMIIDECFTNFADFYVYVSRKYDDMLYFDVIRTYSGLFERICKGNYLKSKEFNS